MGGKSSAPPQPTNPYDVANAQTQTNTQTAINQQNINAVNQQNPYGSVQYTRDPNTGQLTQTSSLNPDAAFQLQAQQAAGAYGSALGLGQLQNVANSVSQPFDINNAGSLQYGVNSSPIQSGFDQGQSVQGNINPTSNSIQTMSAGDVPNVSGGSAYSFNTSGMPNLNKDYGEQYNNVYNSVLNADAPVLQRLSNDQNTNLEDQMGGMGVPVGSDAYNRQKQLLSEQQGQNYNSLAMNAQGQALNTANTLFNQNLGARNQLFGEQATQANNSMQAQQLNQQASMANAANQFNLTNMNNAAQQQEYNQGLQSGQFANQAAGQQYSQNAGQAGFYNQAQNQGYAQNLSNAGLNNQTVQQQLGNQITGYQMPMQIASGLLGFQSNAQMPQSQSPQSSVNAANIQQGVQNYQNQLGDIYNAQVGQQNANTSAAAGLGTAALMAFA